MYEQFHQMSNLYFLIIILLQTIPPISTLPWFALLFPLVLLLGIRGIRDLIDDVVSMLLLLALMLPDLLVKRCVPWQKRRAADLLLLSSSEPNSLCYVETMDIDGETNLKYRQAPLVTHELLASGKSMAAFDGKVMCDEPNSRMHSFVGTLEWHGEMYSLDNEKLLLRGCRIRNTEVCYGLVIYAGEKVRPGWRAIFNDKTVCDCLCPGLLYFSPQITVALVLASLGLAVGSGVWANKFYQEHSYLFAFYDQNSAIKYAFFAFWGFLILLSLVIPMSMLITFEFIYLVNSCFINWDLEMYYAPKDTPAKARSTSLNDQLGQIEFVFSDKTGTLTQNIMSFKKCCINGTIYGNAGSSISMEGEPTTSKYWDRKLEFYNASLLDTIQRDGNPLVREFLRLLALCHTVMVEEKDILYQAASPDEEALVMAARNMGYVFLSRTPESITISELGVERTYEVLALLDFNSVRKRMSILVRDPEGHIKLYTKGADTVILERLHFFFVLALCCLLSQSFAAETLRTLCLATREVDEQEYALWSKNHHDNPFLADFRLFLAPLPGLLFQLLGATAIEDKLQDGVPETIQLLKRGDIKVWVLTGDKQGMECIKLTAHF
uniref:Phospholipid-transporting ATPase n=1 Tax=Varanus komodoensis TaxID=61221 RepID=A0A8D2KW78_VARKO